LITYLLTKVANSKPTNVPRVMTVGSIHDKNGAFTEHVQCAAEVWCGGNLECAKNGKIKYKG